MDAAVRLVLRIRWRRRFIPAAAEGPWCSAARVQAWRLNCVRPLMTNKSKSNQCAEQQHRSGSPKRQVLASWHPGSRLGELTTNQRRRVVEGIAMALQGVTANSIRTLHPRIFRVLGASPLFQMNSSAAKPRCRSGACCAWELHRPDHPPLRCPEQRHSLRRRHATVQPGYRVEVRSKT